MNYVSKFLSNFKEFYNEINSATLTGAIDVVVIRLEDGSYACSPFHVRFGKIGVLRSREKVVDIEINGEPMDIHMKLGESGEAFFVEETEDLDEVPSHLATSPIPSFSIEREMAKLMKDEGKTSTNCLDVRLGPHGNAASSTGQEMYIHTNSRANPSMPSEVDGTQDSSKGDLAGLNRPVDFSKPSIVMDLTKKYNTQGRASASEGGMAEAKSLADSINYVAQASASEQVGVTDEDKIKKKKRRKRSSVRKRKGQGTPGQVSVKAESSDEEPEEIFQMDVDDEEEPSQSNSSSNTSLTRKASIPSNSRTNVAAKPSSLVSSSLQAKDAETGVESTSRASSHSWPYNSTLQLNLEIHPFSDGDVTPILSPVTSRPPTPKSDTEYEIHKQETACQTDTGDNRWSWTWGELPVPPKTLSDKQSTELAVSDDEASHAKRLEQDNDEQRSMLGGMFRFMRKTKKFRHQPESEGIYLDELNPDEMDPEIAKLYFPQRNSSLHLQSAADSKRNAMMHVKDEDVESGNGSSLPQSPYSVEGLGSLHGIDSDTDDGRHPLYDFKGYNDLALSLCGGLASCDGGVIPHERFMHSLVTYDDFCEHPEMLHNPDLVVRLNNKYYNWETVAPMVMSIVLFQRPLSEKTINNLTKEHMPKKQKKSEGKGYSLWSFGWRRNQPADEEQAKKPPEDKSKTVITCDGVEKEREFSESKFRETSPPSEVSEGSVSPVKEKVEKIEKSPPTTLSKIKEDALSTTSTETEIPSIVPMQEDECDYPLPPTPEKENFFTGNERFKKTLRLNSEQISRLNLHQGRNEVVFSVTTAYQGTTRCKCHIYLWNYYDKIVVSDIDGTITKSDVLGHILPIIGKDWAQSGVAQLFTKIKNNGYQFLYLSARAIGQAHLTREYLKSIRQGDVCLPDGPLLLNPSSLISAFHREVIEKKPEEFKISCLKDIQALFPSINPFYAGYGNRINDVWAYRAVGIPISRIFTINHKGELKHELTQTFQSTYSGLSYVVDHLFPPLRRSSVHDGLLTSDFEGSDEFSAFTFWRQPIPEVQIDIADSKSPTPEKRQPDEKSKGKTAAGAVVAAT